MEENVAHVAYLNEYIALSQEWLASAGTSNLSLKAAKEKLRLLNEKYASHSFAKRDSLPDEFEARPDYNDDEDSESWLPSRWQAC